MLIDVQSEGDLLFWGRWGLERKEEKNSSLMLTSNRKLRSPNAPCSEYCCMWVERKLLENGGQGPQETQRPQKNVMGATWKEEDSINAARFNCQHALELPSVQVPGQADSLHFLPAPRGASATGVCTTL